MAEQRTGTSHEAFLASLLARSRFPEPRRAVVCAVSGGPDSTALMALACAAGLHVTALHVDHGLRPGSAADADVVARSAVAVGAEFRTVRVDVVPGPNQEAKARAARYGAMPPDVMTGHTADDQAETILLNLVRGAARDGLAGMRADARHPILALRRAETAELCARMGLAVVHDPTNADPAHRRNRVRHELIPLLDDIAERDVVAVLARQAVLLRDEADLLDDLARAIDPTDARVLAGAPPALARRAVRRLLEAEHPPDGATVERVLAVARGDAGACEIGGGRSLRRSGGRLLQTQRPPRQ